MLLFEEYDSYTRIEKILKDKHYDTPKDILKDLINYCHFTEVDVKTELEPLFDKQTLSK